MVFLIGVMEWTDGEFRIRQFLARRHSEEAPIVAAALESFRFRGGIVSFNGKSFDLPFVKNRALRHRLPIPEEELHVDLLLHARRHWRGMVPNCRLQTLEACLCGRERIGDTPSSFIPGIYRRFIVSGDPQPLLPVLFHNLLDLATLAELLLMLLGGREPVGLAAPPG
jgi:uncharacterized protein YprB with RNaseH-like and TPR domain